MSKHDRPKGSLLDTWFGRPKAKNKSGYQNGSRPSSLENDYLYFHDISNEICKLTIEEVDSQFLDILEDMNIPKDKRLPLLSKSLEEKRDMLIMHIKGKTSQEHRSNSRYEKPMDYISYLCEREHSPSKLYQCLESLRVALTSNPISWIKEFGERGIDEIVRLLQECKQQTGYDKIEFECIRCLKALMNNTWGLNEILKPSQHPALLLLAQCLDPRKPQTMCEALKLLAGICLVSERNGYEKVLSAITSASHLLYKFGERFRSIVDGLFVEYEMKETKRDLCCHTLIFINTITNTSVDLHFRLHLRCEIMRVGLFDKLDTLTEIIEKSNNENLKKHFKIFNEIREDDFEEFSQRFDNVRLELDDMHDCFEINKNLVENTASEPYFLSILQHLLYIRDDHIYRTAYYQLIEECVSQIVLHKSGCDPNFLNRDFHIDAEVLLDDLVEKSKVNEAKRAVEYEKKMEELITGKQEAEAKLANLEEKLKRYENGDSFTKTVPFNPLILAPKALATKSKILPLLPTPSIGISVAPPPPPPPPMLAFGSMPGSGSGPPPPPPPMFGNNVNVMSNVPPTLPYGLKPKKKWNTDGPMKRANWQAIIPHKMSEKSFWIKCEEQNLASPDILSGLCAKFSSKPAKKITKDANDKPSAGKKYVVDLRVLDGKSAQNLLIILGGSLKHLSYDQIKMSLYRCDTTISSNVLQQLIQYLPPPDQLKRLLEIKKKGEVLSGAEDFAATIGEIKRLGPRLQSLNFRLCLPDLIQDIKPDIVAGTAACEEIKRSKRFQQILEFILLIGNYMNSGSKNEQAFGFEISFLTKLSNTKDFENKSTLLHYLAEVVDLKIPDALNFYQDLTHIDKASRVSLEAVQKSLRQITTSLKNLESDISNFKQPQNENDLFVEVMQMFSVECRQQVEILCKMQNHMEALFKEIAEFYAFDPEKYVMEEFFSDLKNFKDSFLHAHTENMKQKEDEEKHHRAQEARKQAQLDAIERQRQKIALVDIDADQTQEGVMDSLLEALQTGSAFGNRDQRKKRGPRPAGAERRAQLSRSRSRSRVGVTGFSITKDILTNELLS